MRLFVGIELPPEIRARLARLANGIPGARWTSAEQMHLTLRFIGEVDGARLQDIDSALAGTSDAAFDMRISGLGVFGTKRAPRLLWAGVEPTEPIEHLQMKVETALLRSGLDASPRKYHPHITLARLKGARIARLGQFIEANGAISTEMFAINEYVLFSSHLSHNGAIYRREARYGLEPRPRMDDGAKINARASALTHGPG